jgi:hypothetical protein
VTRVVITHELDEFVNPPVYRLVHAEQVRSAAPMVDEGDQVLLDDDNHPLTEERVDYVDPVEIVFAADDDRWHTGKGNGRKRRKHADVTAEQRQIVKDAMDAMENAAEGADAERADAITALPGAGESL